MVSPNATFKFPTGASLRVKHSRCTVITLFDISTGFCHSLNVAFTVTEGNSGLCSDAISLQELKYDEGEWINTAVF